MEGNGFKQKREATEKILPVAIMAHNEEKVIQKAVENVLSQNTPIGYSAKVVVVANGCSDRTEEIVKGLEEQNPNRIVLVSMAEKGKTRAINRAIKFFDQISSTDLQIPYVIFLDADCEFLGREVLINFINRFEQNPRLCAVGADCLPDVFLNSRKDIVAEIYRANYTLGQSVKINSISGMCYGVRLDILKKIDFPDFQFAEDMFVSSRLDGHFLKDKNIKIVFKTPSHLRSEIKRRTRQEISTQRYHEYYSYLKRKDGRVSLFEKSLSDDYRWWGATDNHTIKVWFRLKGIKPKFLVMAYALITLWAKIKARRTLTKIKKNEDLDYWKVLR
jgi:glycosyltransferase involved in cell wall biosynthesis